MIRFLHRACLGSLIFAMGSCATAASKQKELKGAVEEFSRGARWNDWGRASAYMTEEFRKQVVPASITENVRVTDVALGGVVTHVEDSAEVTMSVEWYRLTDGTLQRTVIQQTWQQRDEGWRIQGQRTVRGPVLPLLPDVGSPAKTERQSPDDRPRPTTAN
jgi:hypothetical protein